MERNLNITPQEFNCIKSKSKKSNYQIVMRFKNARGEEGLCSIEMKVKDECPKLVVKARSIDKNGIDQVYSKNKGAFVKGSKLPLSLIDYLTTMVKDADQFIDLYTKPEIQEKLKKYDLSMFLRRKDDRNRERGYYEVKPIFNDPRFHKFIEEDVSNNRVNPNSLLYLNMNSYVGNYDFLRYVYRRRNDEPYKGKSRLSEPLENDIQNIMPLAQYFEYPGSHSIEAYDDISYYHFSIMKALKDYKRFREFYLLTKEYEQEKKEELNKHKGEQISFSDYLEAKKRN